MTLPMRRDRFVSIDEYFALEEGSSVRHEYVDGQVHAMAGVTRQHSRIVMNVGARLWAAARRGPCRVHQGEVKLRVGSIVYYPDVMVACGEPPRDTRIEDAPSVLVEVVSPSTERTDSAEKAIVYRGVPNLATYLIIEQEVRAVEWYRRARGGGWERSRVVDSGIVQITTPSLTLSLEDIYEGVELPSAEERMRWLRLREEAASYG